MPKMLYKKITIAAIILCIFLCGCGESGVVKTAKNGFVISYEIGFRQGILYVLKAYNKSTSIEELKGEIEDWEDYLEIKSLEFRNSLKAQ